MEGCRSWIGLEGVVEPVSTPHTNTVRLKARALHLHHTCARPGTSPLWLLL